MRALLLRRVPMPDGVNLAADVYLPDGPGPFPVLLTRTPYHRRTLAARARTFTDWGYAYVVQDVRGKYDSEGSFRPLLDEVEDGRATLDWIAEQSWCDGRIGMVGASYLGIVQIPAASSGHEALRCICPAVAPNSFFTDWVRYDGCFALANMVRWSMSHAVCPTQPAIEHFSWEDLWSQPTLEDLFRKAGYECWVLREWAEHDTYDDYWRSVDQRLMYPKVKVPGLHIGGWFDHLTRGQFQAYAGIRDEGGSELARRNQRLLVGPWGHTNLGGREYGERDFGSEAALDILSYQRRFLDLWMKDLDDGISEEPPVKLFVTGLDRWVDFRDWPVPGTEIVSWHLRSGKFGRLTREGPGSEPPDRFVYDPKDPVPTLGGPVYWGLEPQGPCDQRPILYRDDVLYYASERLGRPLAVVGEVNLELWMASDAEDTDFIAKLCVVEPEGKVVCLTYGSIRCRYRNGWERYEPLSKDEPTLLRIQMGNLAYFFPEGSRIALIVTSSSYPRILPHPNTMTPPWKGTSLRTAEQKVLHDHEHPSRLLLPTVEL
ncbi:MAG TPA: CocE/NonD family hydrolase [Candidatus Latescibacteria bacterium]|nr:CocE/NonD family hydrolase [Candidatus Latescibacterota bacterium]